MFTGNCSSCPCYSHCRCTYAPPFQDGDSEVALNLPGKVMHMRALCSGLASIRPSLLYVKNALEDHHDMDWTIFQDTVARELTMASMFLGGILDGCVIAEMQQSRDKGGPAAPKRSVSFQGTMFQDATLRNIQAGVNGLRSFYFEEQSVQASLWTVIIFWKHYFPYQPLPTEFSRGRLHTLLDFQLVLDSDHAALDPSIPESKDSLNSKPLSGPVVHDLLIPAFNAACGITARLDGDSEVALNLPGKVMHMRALCSGLASIRPSLLYVKNALEDHHDMDWTIFQDTVARELTMASMFLGGILDGCVIAEMQQSRDKGGPAAPKRSVSFQGTMFQDATLRNIQAGVNGLRSFYFEEQSVQASLWTVIIFWKHYFPYQPLPTEFSRGRLHTLLDFQLVLDSDHAALDPGIPESKDSLNSKPLSGPVVHDLLIPAFNAACGITARLVEIYAVSGNHTVDQIILGHSV
eukprot:gene6481-3114_t